MLEQIVVSYGFVFVYAIFGVAGFIVGWVAQRGNYCFVNAMSSVFTTKSYDRFGALLILFGTSALATGGLVAFRIVPAVDQYYNNFFSGWYIIVGALIFGFGATMAGGCNLSMLYRAASGYLQNWLELFGMMVGTFIFAVAIWPFQSYTMAKRHPLNETGCVPRIPSLRHISLCVELVSWNHGYCDSACRSLRLASIYRKNKKEMGFFRTSAPVPRE